MMSVLRMPRDRRHIAACLIPSLEEASVCSFFQHLGERAVQRSKKRDLLLKLLRPCRKYFICVGIIVTTIIDIHKAVNRFEIIFGVAHSRPPGAPEYL